MRCTPEVVSLPHIWIHGRATLLRSREEFRAFLKFRLRAGVALRVLKSLPALLLLVAVATAADVPRDFQLPPPPGEYIAAAPSDANSFRAKSPIVATTYFYWYDAATSLHILDGDGTDALTDHPPTLEDFSYKSVDWHAQQLTDMIAAGIDVAMPVYWSTPLSRGHWSDEGLPTLVAARERLIAEGKTPPAIGMFFDTSTLQHNEGGYHVDLTTDAGRLWFYGTIRNFFSRIPPRHRATIDGRPLVFLYSVAFARRADERLFFAVRKMFQRDFGTDIFLVKQHGWPGRADSEYEWGGALSPQFLDTAAIGPGYDHSAVPGRTPLVRKRDDGNFYRRAWQRLLTKDVAARPWLVHVETWNEFHEGTEICETREYGRQYIDLTREFADQFHAGKQLDPAILRSARKSGSASPGKPEGLSIFPLPDGDGPVVETMIADRPAWTTQQNRFSGDLRYIYFDVDDAFLLDVDETVELIVEYFDAGPAHFLVEYDSADPQLEGLSQQFRPGTPQRINGTGQWKTARFKLPHARFAGRSNNADFRLTATGKDLAIASIELRLKND